MDKSILLIELDKESAAALRKDLSELGAEVAVSPSWEGAAILVQAGLQPDVVLIVWNEGSAGTPAQPTALREHLPDTPFVLVLPGGTEPPKDTAIALGIRRTLTTPVPESGLLAALNEDASHDPAPKKSDTGPLPVDFEDDTNPEEDWLDEALSAKPEFVSPSAFAAEQAGEGSVAASSGADRTNEPPPAPREIPMPGGHVRLSQQRIDLLTNALRSYAKSQKNMILLLSQIGELVACAGDISREAAASIALQVDRERRERADQADDWYYTADVIRGAGDERDSVKFCAMRVAGDLILSTHSDVSASRSMLRDMALEVVDALSLIVMAIETGEIDLNPFDYEVPGEPSVSDDHRVGIPDQESEQLGDPPSAASQEIIDQPLEFNYGDDLDWLTFDVEPSAEPPAETPVERSAEPLAEPHELLFGPPAEPPADLSPEPLAEQPPEPPAKPPIEPPSEPSSELLDGLPPEPLAEQLPEPPAEPLPDLPAEPPAPLPPEPLADLPPEPLADLPIEPPAQPPDELPAELPAEPAGPQAESDFEDLLDFIRHKESVSKPSIDDVPAEPAELPPGPRFVEMLENMGEDAEGDAQVPPTPREEAPAEPQSLGAGTADIARSHLQDRGEDVAAEIVEEASPESTGGPDESVGPPQEGAAAEEGLDEDIFAVADLIFDRLGDVDTDRRIADEALLASVEAMQPEGHDDSLSQYDFLADLTRKYVDSQGEGEEPVPAARDAPRGRSRADRKAANLPSRQRRVRAAPAARARALSNSFSHRLARARQRLKAPWIIVLAVVAVAPFVASVILLASNPGILSRIRAGIFGATPTRQAEILGLELGLPTGWTVADHDIRGTLPPDMVVTFAAEDAEALVALEDSFAEGALSLSGPVVIGMVRTKGVRVDADPTTLLADLQADWPAGDMKFDPPVRTTIDGHDAAVANITVESPGTGTAVRGRLVVVVWSRRAGYLIGAAPLRQWGAFSPAFDAIIESTEFSPSPDG